MELAESFILIAWTIVSLYILRRIGFFSAAPLHRAPERRSNIGLLMFGGVILFYFCLLVIAVILAKSIDGPIMLSHKDEAALESATRPLTQPVTTTDYFGVLMTMSAQNIVGLATAILTIISASRMTLGGVRAFGFDRRKILHGLAVGLLALFLMAPWMLMVENLVAHLGEQIRGGPLPVHPVLQMLRDHPPTSVTVLLVITAIAIAPIVEETIFRGLLQTALLRYFRPNASTRWLSIGIASILFTSVHYQNGPQGVNWEHFPPLLLLSCVLGYVYERTGSLWPNIVLHSLFNTFVTVQTLLMIDAK